jgi:hypothetical protein
MQFRLPRSSKPPEAGGYDTHTGGYETHQHFRVRCPRDSRGNLAFSLSLARSLALSLPLSFFPREPRWARMERKEREPEANKPARCSGTSLVRRFLLSEVALSLKWRVGSYALP